LIAIAAVAVFYYIRRKNSVKIAPTPAK